MTDSLLEVRNLRKEFSQTTNLIDKYFRDLPPVRAVDDVSLSIDRGEITGVIGESGCGKTTLLRTILQIETPTDGEIYFKDEDMTSASEAEMKEYRRNVRMIFQDPFNSLNPRLPVKKILREPLDIHDVECDRDRRVREILNDVELTPAEAYLDEFPTQLSGGERQRVSIARAFVVQPEVVFADEPLSMLDVSTQAALMNLLTELAEEMDLSVVYISHDLSTVVKLCRNIHVMYLGRIVESAATRYLIDDPKHPYTQALIASTPIPDPYYNREFQELPGTPSDPIDLGEGCRFRDRCPERMDICEKTPYLVEVEEDHHAACHLYYDHEANIPESGDVSEFEHTERTAVKTND